MKRNSKSILLGLVLSVALHVLVIFFRINDRSHSAHEEKQSSSNEMMISIKLIPVRLEKTPAAKTKSIARAPLSHKVSPPRNRPLASMDAPPPPTTEEWALASKYTLKNSKRYRYNWGQQVRSMMGTTVEGPDQGIVRFHVEIAPDGKLAKLDTLWSTSAVAEKLARKAIEHMPPLPPTPSGKPLIFEKTISFQPVDSGWPPIYKYDCLPDPPGYSNPFAWDGKSTQVIAQAAPAQPHQSVSEECLANLPQDSLEAEAADMERQLKLWESNELNQ